MMTAAMIAAGPTAAGGGEDGRGGAVGGVGGGGGATGGNAGIFGEDGRGAENCGGQQSHLEYRLHVALHVPEPDLYDCGLSHPHLGLEYTGSLGAANSVDPSFKGEL